jgi:hypothetical protein
MTRSPRSLPNREIFGEHANVVQLLLMDDLFGVSTSFREQCYHTYRILRMEYEPPVPFALIGKVFGVDQGTVRNHAKRYATELNAVKSPGSSWVAVAA